MSRNPRLAEMRAEYEDKNKIVDDLHARLRELWEEILTIISPIPVGAVINWDHGRGVRRGEVLELIGNSGAKRERGPTSIRAYIVRPILKGGKQPSFRKERTYVSNNSVTNPRIEKVQ